MELSIPPPFSDPSSVPPNTPATTAEIKPDSAEAFKFPVEEIIKGLDQVIASESKDGVASQASASSAPGGGRLPPTRILGDAKAIISSLYKRIDELDATVSMLQTWNKKLQEENGELRLREGKALKLLKSSENDKFTLERQLSLQNKEASAVDEAMERTLRELADL